MEDYIKRRQALFNLLDIVIEDPAKIDEIITPFILNPSVTNKFKVALKFGVYALENKKTGFFEQANLFRSVFSYYKPEALKLFDVISGRTEYNKDAPNFFIQWIQDPETLAFFQKNGARFSALTDKLSAKLIAVGLEEINKKPDTDELKIFIAELKKNGFDQSFFINSTVPKINAFVSNLLQDPNQVEQLFKRINILVPFLLSPATPLSKSAMAFLKKMESPIRHLVSHPVFLRLALNILSGSRKDDQDFIKDLGLFLHHDRWDDLFQAIPAFLKENSVALHNLLDSNWNMLQEQLALPSPITVKFMHDILSLGVLVSADLAPVVLKLSREVFVGESNQKTAVELIRKFLDSRSQPLPANEEREAPQENATWLYALMLPQFLDALTQNGVNIEGILKAVGTNVKSLLKIGQHAAHIAFSPPELHRTSELRDHQLNLFNAIFEFAFNSQAPFIAALGPLSAEELGQGILNAPLLKSELERLKIDEALIVGAIPILRKTVEELLKNQESIRTIIQYYWSASTDTSDLKFIQAIQKVVGSLSFKMRYLIDNKLKLLDLIDFYFIDLQEQFNIPLDFSKDFIKETAGLSIDLSRAILPFIGEILKAVLADKNHDILLKIKEQAYYLAKVKDTPQEEGAMQNLIHSIFELDSKGVILNKLPFILNTYAQPLGGIVNQFLTHTDIGKKWKIDGAKFLEVASRHIPKLKAISELYLKKDLKWVRKAGSLLLDPQVLRFLITTLVRSLIHRHYAKKNTSTYLKAKLNDFLTENSGTKMMDLGYWLDTEAKKSGKRINRNLKGLHFSTQGQALSFSNCILKDFNFNKAQLQDLSFENSVIKNCSFKGVTFVGKPNFKGAKIDEASLKTLQPAIEAYNRSNLADPILPEDIPRAFKLN